jgi:hypothetical protein
MRTRRLRKLNTTQRKNGGAKLGEGARGICYDIYSESDESLHQFAGDSKKIELFFPDGTSEVIDNEEKIKDFLESLKKISNSIAKIFKPVSIFSFKSIQSEFINELKTNRRIIELYGLKNAKKYTTLTGVEINNKSVSGAIFSGRSVIYTIFNKKCVGKYDMDIKQFTIDINDNAWQSISSPMFTIVSGLYSFLISFRNSNESSL